MLRQLPYSVVCVLVMTQAVIGLDQPCHKNKASDQDNSALKALQEYIGVLPDRSIHSILHDHIKEFKDGVFRHDRTAVEEVHNGDPSLASKIVAAAAAEAHKLDLVKRADNNVTVVPTNNPPASTAKPPASNPPPASSAPAPPASSAPPPASSPKPSSNPPPVASTAPSAPANSASAPASPSTNGKPSVTTPVEVKTTTNSQGSTVVVSSPIPTTAIPVTTTDSSGNTFVTSITPSDSPVSSLFLQTVTLPDGQLSTLTSYQVVGGPTGQPNSPNQPSQSGRSPSVQNGATMPTHLSAGLVSVMALVVMAAIAL